MIPIPSQNNESLISAAPGRMNGLLGSTIPFPGSDIRGADAHQLLVSHGSASASASGMVPVPLSADPQGLMWGPSATNSGPSAHRQPNPSVLASLDTSVLMTASEQEWANAHLSIAGGGGKTPLDTIGGFRRSAQRQQMQMQTPGSAGNNNPRGGSRLRTGSHVGGEDPLVINAEGMAGFWGEDPGLRYGSSSGRPTSRSRHSRPDSDSGG